MNSSPHTNDAPDLTIPIPRGPIPQRPDDPPHRQLSLEIDGRCLSAPEGSTILEAARTLGIETPTLCFLENLTPVNVCRLCVVEVEGSRVLVPACSRPIEQGMKVHTNSDRVRLSRRLVLEFLASSVDLSTAPQLQKYLSDYNADPSRFNAATQNLSSRPERSAVEGPLFDLSASSHSPATHAHTPPKDDNPLYVRSYAKCVLCYKCVQACGTEAQNTFAIAVAGRGFGAHISTEFDVPLTSSACVYCGNCIGVCPTGALVFRSEFLMRQAGAWDESRQSSTDTICPYCGVGCTLTLLTQSAPTPSSRPEEKRSGEPALSEVERGSLLGSNSPSQPDGSHTQILRVTSPLDHSVSHGHLCIKGRFGYQFVQIHQKL